MENKNIVIGTAGHIDHGKSAIVKALTGIDPTRLDEEKKRNITIDLGFSYIKTPTSTIGIVDLPGHEKFINNMIVGAQHTDMVLLVIAADDGIMPQTIEHFEILSLLKIQHAIIVLTKTDLVSTDIVKQRIDEIKEFFKGTTFENSLIIESSIYDNNSIENLKTQLLDYVDNTDFASKQLDIFRLAVDRSFAKKGLGTIITGTSQGKTLKLNDELQVYPGERIVKVKNIQNHHQDVESVESGQRTAIQLSKIAHTEIKRGDILATPNSMHPVRFIDAELEVLKSSKPLKNNQLIRLFHQNKEYIGRIKSQTPKVQNGTTQYVTIVLQDPIYAIRGDFALVRTFSPIKTVGSIKILNLLEKMPKRTNNYYDQYQDSSLTNLIKQYLHQHGYANEQQLLSLLPQQDALKETINYLTNQGVVTIFNYNQKNAYILTEDLKQLQEQAETIVEDYHQNHPLEMGMNVNELFKLINPPVQLKMFRHLIKLFDNLELNDELIKKKRYRIKYSAEQNKRKNGMLTIIKQRGYQLFTFKELYEKFDQKGDKEIIQALIDEKVLLIIDQKYVILDRMYKNAINFLNDLPEQFTLADFKNKVDCSRKYCVLLLEHFDEKNITKREGDYRIKLKS